MRAGETDAVKLFCEKYHPHISRIALNTTHHLGSRIDAQDIASEVLLRIFHLLRDSAHPLPLFTNEQDFSRWIVHVSRHLALEHLRREHRHKRVDATQNIEVICDNDAGESAHDIKEQIDWAICQLPEREGTIIRLMLEEATIGEIAAQLGLSESSVRVIHSRARRKLRKILEKSFRPIPLEKNLSPTDQVKTVIQAVGAPKSDVTNAEPYVTPRGEVDPLVEVYFAGDNFSSKEIRLFLDYLAARYREIGGIGLTVVEGQTLVPEMVGVTT